MATTKAVDDSQIQSAISTNTKNKGGIIVLVTVLVCVAAFVFLKYKNNFLK